MASGIINALGSVAQGVLHGHALANQIRQAADEHEMALRQQFQQERNNRLQDEQLRRQGEDRDLQAQMMMQQSGRPVVGGMVQDTSTLPTVPGMVGSGQTFGVTRKADASRLIKHTMMNGEALQAELYSPDEQRDRELKRAVTNADTLGAAADARRLALLKGEEDVKEPYRKEQDKRARDLADETDKRARDLADVTDKRARDLKLIEETGSNTRNTATNKSRERAAGIRKSADRGLTPNAEGVQGRFDQRQIDDATKTHDKLQEQEQTLHTLRTEIGDALGAADPDEGKWSSGGTDGGTFIDPKTGKTQTMNALYRSRLTAQLGEATTKVAELQKRQAAIRKKFGWGEFAAPAGDAASRAAAGKPIKGDPMKHNGVDYVFDGAKYVKQ